MSWWKEESLSKGRYVYTCFIFLIFLERSVCHVCRNCDTIAFCSSVFICITSLIPLKIHKNNQKFSFCMLQALPSTFHENFCKVILALFDENKFYLSSSTLRNTTHIMSGVDLHFYCILLQFYCSSLTSVYSIIHSKTNFANHYSIINAHLLISADLHLLLNL